MLIGNSHESDKQTLPTVQFLNSQIFKNPSQTHPTTPRKTLPLKDRMQVQLAISSYTPAEQ